MWGDKVLEEVRAIREAHAARFKPTWTIFGKENRRVAIQWYCPLIPKATGWQYRTALMDSQL